MYQCSHCGYSVDDEYYEMFKNGNGCPACKNDIFRGYKKKENPMAKKLTISDEAVEAVMQVERQVGEGDCPFCHEPYELCNHKERYRCTNEECSMEKIKIPVCEAREISEAIREYRKFQEAKLAFKRLAILLG